MGKPVALMTEAEHLRKLAADKAYYHLHKEERAEYHRQYRTENKDRIAEYQRENADRFRDAMNTRCRKYKKNHPGIQMLLSARHRAKKNGLPFDLSLDDIIVPTHCPVLGIPLFSVKGQSRPPVPNAPTLDRVIPSLGYVNGNVQVISFRANTLKRDGTLEEIEAIARYMREHQWD